MSKHPESRCTHPVCDDCWFNEHFIAEPEGPTAGGVIRFPSRLVDAHREWEQCCRCGSMTFSGIFERADPDDEDHRHYCGEAAARL